MGRLLCAIIFVSATLVAQGSPPSPAACEALSAGAQTEPLRSACRFTLTLRQSLPNFLCRQVTERHEPSFTADDRHPAPPPSKMTAEVAYFEGVESYHDVKLNGRANRQSILDLSGMASIGEFGTALEHIFDPSSAARFRFLRETSVDLQPATIFEFTIDEQHSLWSVREGGHSAHPGYQGTIWVVNESGRIVRLDEEAKLDSSFSVESDSLVLNYAEVPIGGIGTFSLPVSAKRVDCLRGYPEKCFRNVIKFTDYRKFAVNSKILTSPVR